MRVSSQKLNPSLKNQITKTLAQTISTFKSIKEVDLFLNDFLNDSEYESFAKRLAIAYWLKKKRSYSNRKNNLKVSSATIAQTQKDMDRPGFALALKKLEAEEWASVWEEKIKGFLK